MFQTIYHIASNYLKRTYSSRAVLIFQLLMPLIFTFLIGQAIGGPSSSSSSTSVEWILPIVNEDEGTLGQTLITILDNDPAIKVEEMGLETAVSLYRNDLLTGFTCDSPPFEEWLRSERERFLEQGVGRFKRSPLRKNFLL